MDFEVRCVAASGRSCVAGAFLATRYDAATGFRPGDGECHVVRVLQPPDYASNKVVLSDLLSTDAWLTGLWCADNGALFVTDSQGTLYVAPNGGVRDSKKVKWKEKETDCTLWGVWGLDEKRVWAWGRRSGEGALFRWMGVVGPRPRRPISPSRAFTALRRNSCWRPAREAVSPAGTASAGRHRPSR